MDDNQGFDFDFRRQQWQLSTLPVWPSHERADGLVKTSSRLESRFKTSGPSVPLNLVVTDRHWSPLVVTGRHWSSRLAIRTLKTGTMKNVLPTYAVQLPPKRNKMDILNWKSDNRQTYIRVLNYFPRKMTFFSNDKKNVFFRTKMCFSVQFVMSVCVPVLSSYFLCNIVYMLSAMYPILSFSSKCS
jgi:hypothetical protein